MSKKVDDFRWVVKNQEIVPIITGGMGVDISSDKLAIEAARLGGIGHISDAMVPTVTDRHYKTQFSRAKYDKYKEGRFQFDKTDVHFDLQSIEQATKMYVQKTMSMKKGNGLVFVNCMEKLTMNNPKETLRARLSSALDAGIDGITLSAGLHLGSFDLVADHPRFRDAMLGVIVSSVRALKVFLRRANHLRRLPDYVIVEGPLAGGHLGFDMDWKNYDLKTIFQEVMAYVKKESLPIPVIVAGGIFTGADAVEYLEGGASAVQVATRFTVTEECGLPSRVKQHYFQSQESDVVVSQISPTGYPMRVLKTSPGLNQYIRPNCENYGFLLDKNGHCAYLSEYEQRLQESVKNNTPLTPGEKVCLCTHMRNYKIWTCGHYTYRLKDTSVKKDSGDYQILTAEHVFNDYRYSTDHNIRLPEKREEQTNTSVSANIA